LQLKRAKADEGGVWSCSSGGGRDHPRFQTPAPVVCSILYNLAKAPDNDAKWQGDGGANFFFNAISECWKTFKTHTRTHS